MTKDEEKTKYTVAVNEAKALGIMGVHVASHRNVTAEDIEYASRWIKKNRQRTIDAANKSLKEDN